MKVRFFKIAQYELDDAVEYYNVERPGLGYEFLWEVFEAIDRIKAFPEAWQPFHRGTRKCQIRRFPYGVIYKQIDKLLLIIAVASLHRRPDYWIVRLPEKQS
ncbi:MAG: hypothetical protein MAG551_00929 [Candidatus Scalindua arabica]|uniref:Plasmid stabilization system protein n=1 Tax=Candidatus Scalindua arabica TaxID=1127984 RepID=A0A941W3K1_9BACT|nr:hypothetical protein [Candidatus Scalindua arabica]